MGNWSAGVSQLRSKLIESREWKDKVKKIKFFAIASFKVCKISQNALP